MTRITDPAADAYAAAHTSPLSGAAGAAATWTRANAASPGMMAGLLEARLLQALIVAGGAQRVIEVGTFTGVGTLAMAAALPAGGRITTLELDEDNAAAARRHFAASPEADKIELIVGDARETLASLPGPFDLVWIDAWKSDYPAYWDLVASKVAPRGVVLADNLFRGGQVLDPAAAGGDTDGLRVFADRVQADERFDNALLTIGDGVMLAWRRPA